MPRYFERNNYLQKFYFSRTGIERILLLSSVFSIALVIIRVAMTGSKMFLFLPWNLLLAFIPYYITKKLMANPAWIENKWKLIAAALLWLVFIPNSFYIITDLFHLGKYDEAPRWFDLTLIFSFAWNGLVLGIVSVKQMESIVKCYFAPRYAWLFIYTVMWLNALGIFIGRFLRFNSWDIITNPLSLINEIITMVVHPFDYMYVWGMICFFAVLMTIMYITVRRIGEMAVR
jgi:uncharacterized membrane protein